MSLLRSTPDGPTVRVRGREQPYLERRRIGRRDYYLLERIGGPFRERFRAYDPRSGPGGSDFLIQRWPAGPRTDQQLRLWRRLKDDSLPRVVEWQRDNNQLDVVLTWIEGLPLAEYLQHIQCGRRPAIDPGQALRLIHGLANAVCKLHHHQQVAHGDIQPANVIITSHASRLTLIDFGSGWTTQATVDRHEGDGHHPSYAAPELQTHSTPVGFFADQFSVSVLCYELLTGKIPYGGLGGKAGRPEFIERAERSLQKPSEVSEACAALPKSLRCRLDEVVVRGLALDPAKRYPNRHVWLDELFEAHARFRLKPELPPVERALTRVIGWFLKSRQSD